MTREEARKAAEVMLAYADGKQIEYKVRGGNEWRSVNELDTPLFDWNSTKYRIKPEFTYRPFKDRDECWAEMQKHQPFGWILGKYSGAYENLSAVCSEKVFREDSDETFDTIYHEITFADGTPFGIKEE